MTSDSLQETYSPSDFTFCWTEDDWYEFNRLKGRKLALAARRERAKELKARGWDVQLWALSPQLRSFGGIGSGRPHIELVEPCYMLNAWPPTTDA